MSELRVGIGSSSAADSVAAGDEAARAAVAELAGADPALIMVFASIAHDLPALLAAVRTVTGAASLVGSTTSGVFHDGEVIPPGHNITVLALTEGPYRFGTAAVTGLLDDALEAGRRLARSCRDAVGTERRRHGTIILLADGMGGDLQALLAGIYQVGGAGVPVVGGAAGDDRRLVKTYVMHDDRVLEDGAVAVWVDSDRPLTVSAKHGWQSVSLPMFVTSVDGTVVHEIGGRPAAEVYGDYIPKPRTAGDDADDAADRPAGESPTGLVPETWYAAHALGLIEPDGTQMIRGCYLGPDGALHTFAPLPPLGSVEVVSCNPDDLLGITEDVAEDALGARAGDARLLLTFSCVARLDILGERASEEAERLRDAAHGARTFGFYTYGEFARTAGVAGFHNATLAAVAL